jgi:hypothetical protein
MERPFGAVIELVFADNLQEGMDIQVVPFVGDFRIVHRVNNL